MKLRMGMIGGGEENNLTIRIYGEKGGLRWSQMEPNTLTLLWPDAPVQLARTGTTFPGMDGTAAMHTRIPSGHPEGFIEAFANLYRSFLMHLSAVTQGRDHDAMLDYPSIREGVRGMKFLEAVVSSSAKGSAVTAL